VSCGAVTGGTPACAPRKETMRMTSDRRACAPAPAAGAAPGTGWQFPRDFRVAKVAAVFERTAYQGVFIALALATILLRLPGGTAPPPGRWRSCGYDLTGNVSGRCPECGALVTAKRV
jgi:hypothetical protein